MAAELDPNVAFDRLLLAAMRSTAVLVADGVLADVIDNGVWVEVRAVLATDHRIPGAVGSWLDTLPTDRRVIIPAVVSGRLAGMLARRGFERRHWWDHRLGLLDEDAMLRDPKSRVVS